MPGIRKTKGNMYLPTQPEQQCDNPKQEEKVSTTGTNDDTARLAQDKVLLKDLLGAIRTSGDEETWQLLRFIKAGACRSEIRQYLVDRGLVQGDELDRNNHPTTKEDFTEATN